jgi:hypothetical protein
MSYLEGKLNPCFCDLSFPKVFMVIETVCFCFFPLLFFICFTYLLFLLFFGDFSFYPAPQVEHVVREEKTMAAYELIEIYCELIMARLPMIESQKYVNV